MAITTTMDTEQVAGAYDRWAPVYDLVFGPVFRHGRRAAATSAEAVGGRILEVGVGTGLSLAGYGKGTHVFGITAVRLTDTRPFCVPGVRRVSRQNRVSTT